LQKVNQAKYPVDFNTRASDYSVNTVFDHTIYRKQDKKNPPIAVGFFLQSLFCEVNKGDWFAG